MKKIVVISAIWCSSCLIIKKNLKKLKEDYPDLVIDTLDYDFDMDIVKNYNVEEILPVIIVTYNDLEISRLIGEHSYQDIVSFLKENEVL